MTAFPSLHPIESSTLGAPSALFAAELAERISLALRAIAEGMHVGSVGLDEAVRELGDIWQDTYALDRIAVALRIDGKDQLATEHSVVGFLAGRQP